MTIERIRDLAIYGLFGAGITFLLCDTAATFMQAGDPYWTIAVGAALGMMIGALAEKPQTTSSTK